MENKKLTKLQHLQRIIYSYQFVQGMNYALDLMNISGRGENKEILERFLRNIEYIDKSFGGITPRLNPDGSYYGVEPTTQNDLENGGTK